MLEKQYLEQYALESYLASALVRCEIPPAR